MTAAVTATLPDQKKSQKTKKRTGVLFLQKSFEKAYEKVSF